MNQEKCFNFDYMTLNNVENTSDMHKAAKQSRITNLFVGDSPVYRRGHISHVKIESIPTVPVS